MISLTDLLLLTLGLSIGGLFGYFISYSKQKGKNQALIEDVNRLENEKQEVIPLLSKTGFILDSISYKVGLIY